MFQKTLSQAKKIKRDTENKSIVLVGGCFDILHPGHIKFLQKAKEQGDILVILLESDERVKKSKGPNRPIHTQMERSFILSSLKMVDYVIQLPLIVDNDYDQLISIIKPKIIATTKGDPSIAHKERTARLVGALVKVVTPRLKKHSSTNLLDNFSLSSK